MNEVYLACIMIGVNHLARILGPMIFSMQTICSPRLKRGVQKYSISHSSSLKHYSFDKLHSNFTMVCGSHRCNLVGVVVEVDRILRPEGKLIVRDDVETINELEKMLKSMHWEVRLTYSKDNEGLLCVQKSQWRPQESEIITYAIA